MATKATVSNGAAAGRAQKGRGWIEVPTKGDKVKSFAKPSPDIAVTQQFDDEMGMLVTPSKPVLRRAVTGVRCTRGVVRILSATTSIARC